jgi:hypothetical protein
MEGLIHSVLLLIEHMLLFILHGAQQGASLIGAHATVLAFIPCGSLSGLLFLRLRPLLAT